MTCQTKCHYEVLSVPRDADAATIKKAHRKLALQHHPDKNTHKSPEEQDASAAEFKLIQAAYECLSDPVERKWYDEHRDMILRGGLHGNNGSGGNGGDGSSFLFDVMPYQFAGCYDGYSDDDPDGFYAVYGSVFEQIFQGEKDGFLSEGNIDYNDMPNAHLGEVSMGNSKSDWEDISAFYAAWEAFSSCLSYAWEDIYHLYDIKEAPNRRIRRLMEEDNRKKRKTAKKERIDEVCALVRFVKKRDPRVKKQREKIQREQEQRQAEKMREAEERKKEVAVAREEWRAEAERNMAEQEAADLDAGRIRLADLDSDDDYDYGGCKRGKKKKGKRKGKGKQKNTNYSGRREETGDDFNNDHMPEEIADATNDIGIPSENSSNIECDHVSQHVGVKEVVEGELQNFEEFAQDNTNEVDVSSSSEDDSDDDEPESWRCECCKKDFKSEKQFENHAKSKKHKENMKKYEKKLQKEAEKMAILDIMDEIP
mmetsp:Transcript_9436/g.19621  ORF Transcript_9436/g.19621 Transcript_9436/m.19621 type:complete len:482 (+) Transcript_9436:185-1630(+)